MSTKRLTGEELATYMIGAAIRRTLATAPNDPEMKHEIPVICRWIETGLTPEEAGHVLDHTGHDFAGFLDNDLNTPPPPDTSDDDPDVPF